MWIFAPLLTVGAALSTPGSMSGSASLSFAGSGALEGSAEIAGSSSIAFSHTASASSIVSVTGSTSLAFTGSATPASLIVTDKGGSNQNTSGLTWTHSGENFQNRDALVVWILAVDNADTSGTAHSTFTVTDSVGNTWTRRISGLYDPGLANEGVELAVFTTGLDVGAIGTSDTLTVTFDVATTVKATVLFEVKSTTGGRKPVYVTGGVGTGSATTTPSITTGSIAAGNMVLCAAFCEYGTEQTFTGDTDTTNGRWSAIANTRVGSTTTGLSIGYQYKLVDAAGAQTWSPTLGTSADVIPAWIEINDPRTLNVTVAAGTFATTGQDIALSRSRNVTAAAGSFTMTGQAVALRAARSMSVATGEFATTGSSLIMSRGYPTGSGSFVWTGYAIGMSRERRLTADVGTYVWDGMAVGMRSTPRITVGAGSFVLTGKDVLMSYGVLRTAPRYRAMIIW